MHKIMFVCHGNICRSPMAEMILKSIVKEKGLGEEYIISSSATSLEEIGNSIYPPARRVLMTHGIEIEDHRAVQLTRKDYEFYDLIICMDRMNERNILRIIGEDRDKKIKLFKEYGNYRDQDVADPWYTDNFDLTFKELFDLCHCLVDYLSIKH